MTPGPAAPGRNDIDALLDAATAPLPPTDLAAALAAQRAAATAPQTSPSVIPEPTFPRAPAAPWWACPVARYACPRGCGWSHDEPTDDGAPLRIVVPADPTPDDVTAAITAHAAARAKQQRARIEKAITDHLADAHDASHERARYFYPNGTHRMQCYTDNDGAPTCMGDGGYCGWSETLRAPVCEVVPAPRDSPSSRTGR